MFHCTTCGTEFVAARDACSDCGGAVVAGDSPRYAKTPARSARPPAPPAEAPAPRAAHDGPRPELPPSGLRHCASCGAEFAGSVVDCSDCGEPLHPGPSPRFDGADDTADRGAPGDLSAEDFVPLATIPNGWQADTFCGVLGEAGIATMMATARGRRMRAPGLEPIGPAPAENETVEILVFPEMLDEARVILAEAMEQHPDSEPFEQPRDGAGTQCGVNCEHVAEPEAGHPVLALALAGIVVVLGIAAVVLFH